MNEDIPAAELNEPRPLTLLERQVVARILTDECPGVVELRAQLENARVLRHWPPPGSPSIDLEVLSETSPAPLAASVLPMDTHVYGDDGSYIGEILIWLTEGRLAAVEFAWVTDSMPDSLPPPEALRVNSRT